MSLVIINSAVDSLYFSYKGQAKKGFYEYLDSLKHQAQVDEENVPFELHSVPLVMYSYNAHKFRYRMRGKDYFLFASPSKTLPNLKFQMLAESLYQNGYVTAFKLADDLTKKIGDMSVAKLSRLDLCVDFQGFDMSDERFHDFVCRSNMKAAWWSGDQPNGFHFGKGAVQARLYNKTKEIEIHNKGWMEAVWRECPQYDTSKPVWRIEYQFKREALKEFEIDTVQEGFAKLAGLWTYGLGWLSLRFGDETRKERRPIDPNWVTLKEADFLGLPCSRVRATKSLCDSERATAQILGYAVSQGARWNRRTIRGVMEVQVPEMERRLAKKETTFAELVQKKLDGLSHDELW